MSTLELDFSYPISELVSFTKAADLIVKALREGDHPVKIGRDKVRAAMLSGVIRLNYADSRSHVNAEVSDDPTFDTRSVRVCNDTAYHRVLERARTTNWNPYEELMLRKEVMRLVEDESASKTDLSLAGDITATTFVWNGEDLRYDPKEIKIAMTPSLETKLEARKSDDLYEYAISVIGEAMGDGLSIESVDTTTSDTACYAQTTVTITLAGYAHDAV
jgi:hypothetical protein